MTIIKRQKLRIQKYMSINIYVLKVVFKCFEHSKIHTTSILTGTQSFPLRYCNRKTHEQNKLFVHQIV